MHSSEEPRKYIFSAEELTSLSALGAVLKGIRLRLRKEGWVVRDGKLYKELGIIKDDGAVECGTE